MMTITFFRVNYPFNRCLGCDEQGLNWTEAVVVILVEVHVYNIFSLFTLYPVYKYNNLISMVSAHFYSGQQCL